MFVSQYVCHIVFTLLYLGSYLDTECYGFHLLDYTNSNHTSRIKRQSCGFRCADGQCIARHSQCDGTADCSDNSDEDFKCLELSKSCQDFAFRCAYGACVDGDARCNGVQDCADNSDEIDCRNATTHNCGSKFACKSGQCIDRYLLCDGAKDCSDGSDETVASCNGIACHENSYRCAYGACVDGDSKCNGISECADGSDESPRICSGTPVTLPTLPCALPPQPANGKYTSLVTPSLTILTYSCLPGYKIYPSPNNNIAICNSGKWYPGLSECLRTKCGPRISDSVETYCERKGIKVDCSKPMVEGTTVQMKCKHLHSPAERFENLVSVCSAGSWSYPFIKCVSECGNIIPGGSPLVIGGEHAKKGAIPWHVGIYKLNDLNQYELICGGSIISSELILSAAHCFAEYANGAPLDVKKFAIAAGKYYRNYYEKRDILSQNSTVKKIIIPERFKGLKSSFSADIAVVILDKALEITHVVQPVCIDWNNQYEVQQLRDNNEGIVVGWGFTDEFQDPSVELKQLSVPFINFAQCYKSVPEGFTHFLTYDKFCAGFTNGSSVCHGDSGGGLVFKLPDNKKYYLRGLVSVGPVKEGACDSRQYSAYTKVSDYMHMLRDVILSMSVNNIKHIQTIMSWSVVLPTTTSVAFYTPVTPPVTPPTLPDGSCAFPPQPANGKYTSLVTQSLIKLTYSCSPGYQISPSPSNNIAICESGKWYPGLSECLRPCGPRISDSVETHCERKGIKVDCSKPMVEGTAVQMNCKHLYSQVDSSANPVSVCRDGSWDYSFIKCVPECGNIVPEGGAFIFGGEHVKEGAIPWHVGIYKLNELNQYEQKCGGSIINRRLILSAAHCFTNYANGAPLDVKQYAIAAGKYYRNYYETKDEFSQNSTVKKIVIPERYKGLKTSFTADIAFVILDKALEITHVVQPVCIDWNNQYEIQQLRDHNEGIVVGWGFTNEGQDSSVELKQLSVPFINFATCSASVPENFIRFLTNDKFCAEFTNGSSVCHGDSGGGLVFKKEDTKKYYLRGVVSVGPLTEGKCDSRQYGAYTKVSDYIETLREVEVNTRW